MDIISRNIRSHRTIPLTLIYFFFFNDTATTEIYTLSLHDALPISFESKDGCKAKRIFSFLAAALTFKGLLLLVNGDRKSTRLNSSHQIISYAVFCLKKKKIRRCVSKALSFYNL